MQTKEQRKAWLEKNQHKYSKYQKTYRDKNPDYLRKEANRYLKKKYGITIEQKQEMHDAQSGLCAVCKLPLPDIMDRDCQVDHCHTTNKVRKLLHWYCNIIVGVLENNKIPIGNVAEYIRLCDSPNLQEKQL